MNIESIEDLDDGGAMLTVVADTDEMRSLAAEALVARLVRAAEDVLGETKEARLREALMKAKIAHSEAWHREKKLRLALADCVDALARLIATDSVHPAKVELARNARDQGSNVLLEPRQ